MKTLNVYLGTTSGGKRDLMKAFGQGAEKHGIKVDYITLQNKHINHLTMRLYSLINLME